MTAHLRRINLAEPAAGRQNADRDIMESLDIHQSELIACLLQKVISKWIQGTTAECRLRLFLAFEAVYNLPDHTCNCLEYTDSECKRPEVTKFEFTSRLESVESSAALQDIRDLIAMKRATTKGGEHLPSHLSHRSSSPSDIFREKPYLRFYGEQKHVMKVFLEEMDAQLDHGNPDIAAILGSACGALPRLIQRAAKSSQLNQFLVALSSCESGTNVKRSCFITYAQTMCIEGDVVKASAFYFGAGEISSAIRCFLKAKCYRDAFAACRLRFDRDHDLLKECIDAWASKFIRNGCYEAAAKCHIAVDDFDSASEALVRRQSAHASYEAIKLAFMANKREKASDIAHRCLHLAMVSNDWQVGWQVVHLCPEFEPWKYIISMHESLVWILCNSSTTSATSQVDKRSFHREVYSLTTKDFLHSVWHIWVHQGINAERLHLIRLIEMTRSRYYSPVVNNLKTMLPGLATNLALGLFLVLVNEKESLGILSGLSRTVSLFNDVSQLVEQMISLPNYSYARNVKSSEMIPVWISIVGTHLEGVLNLYLHFNREQVMIDLNSEQGIKAVNHAVAPWTPFSISPYMKDNRCTSLLWKMMSNL